MAEPLLLANTPHAKVKSDKEQSQFPFCVAKSNPRQALVIATALNRLPGCCLAIAVVAEPLLVGNRAHAKVQYSTVLISHF